ncbi:MAG TPA: inner membrane protein YhjD [Pseudonocardia sp.]|uniref:inner membrane protein YhjD n=1 Tax=Pseudonocardia sp. TaxID=60912 RepID=UPI002CE4DBE0|nr:inner membrane protein YhjD [Pseudonocardia sp.]HTF48695.1 inner membrane protein YhjD [Pseudonocardia sp.]
MTEQPNKPSRLTELRRRYAWLDHLVRAEERYTETHGDHYAAAITYFSILALVPLLMIAFATVALVLAANPDLLARLRANIAKLLPTGLDQTLDPVIDQAVKSATTVGVIGLLFALYSGLSWMTNLREALSEQWGQRRNPPTLLLRLRVDLARLIGLGLAMAISFGLPAAVSGFAEQILGFFGLADVGWAHWLLGVLAVLLGLLSDWLVFLWVFARLPREPVTWRSAARAAISAAIGFEVIKQVMVIYLAKVTETPTGAAFGPILGLLIFIFTVSRFLLFLTAWAATAPENQVEQPPPAPPPAVIRPEVTVRNGPGAGAAAGLLGAGAVVGLLGGRLLGRRRASSLSGWHRPWSGSLGRYRPQRVRCARPGR